MGLRPVGFLIGTLAVCVYVLLWKVGTPGGCGRMPCSGALPTSVDKQLILYRPATV